MGSEVHEVRAPALTKKGLRPERVEEDGFDEHVRAPALTKKGLRRLLALAFRLKRVRAPALTEKGLRPDTRHVTGRVLLGSRTSPDEEGIKTSFCSRRPFEARFEHQPRRRRWRKLQLRFQRPFRQPGCSAGRRPAALDGGGRPRAVPPPVEVQFRPRIGRVAMTSGWDPLAPNHWHGRPSRGESARPMAQRSSVVVERFP